MRRWWDRLVLGVRYSPHVVVFAGLGVSCAAHFVGEVVPLGRLLVPDVHPAGPEHTETVKRIARAQGLDWVPSVWSARAERHAQSTGDALLLPAYCLDVEVHARALRRLRLDRDALTAALWGGAFPATRAEVDARIAYELQAMRFNVLTAAVPLVVFVASSLPLLRSKHVPPLGVRERDGDEDLH